MNTNDIIRDLRNLEDFFDVSRLDENHELFRNKKSKVIGNVILETPKKIWIAEFVCLRSEMYSFQCGDDSKNKLKGISESESKHIKFEEYKNSFDGEEYQTESINYILCSINHEMQLQEIKESTLSLFDDKRCYINKTKSIPWNWSYFNRLKLS